MMRKIIAKYRGVIALVCTLSIGQSGAAPLPSAQYLGVFIGPRSTHVLVAHTFGWKVSHDDGRTWQSVAYPFDELQTGKDLKSFRSVWKGGVGSGAIADWPIPSPGRADTRNSISYSCMGEHIYKGTDGGLSWDWVSDIPTGPQRCVGIKITARGITVGVDNGIYLSADQGRTWIRLATPGGSILSLLGDGQGRLFATISMDAKKGGKLAAISSGDGGRSWETIALPQKESDPMRQTTFIATVRDRLFISSTLGLSYSDDAGNSWHDFSDGLETHGAAIFDLYGASDGTLFAANEGGVFRRASSHKRWERVRNLFP